ncbi:hypothetical protein F5B22DRAFT_552251 [Xylaria bambusicola]|uniref:uncharacterized protein n=1 Tax=Xylaria bambusicola TaxID=326684 RepID=UPI002008DB6B|nr:uncharacterized protein F5B22DRAFT_552251 [Xylaria bambusicola]KAI0503351.1 hypothetical protein F5B22DRAFT_552251 [Xylaria bambusicola]
MTCNIVPPRVVSKLVSSKPHLRPWSAPRCCSAKALVPMPNALIRYLHYRLLSSSRPCFACLACCPMLILSVHPFHNFPCSLGTLVSRALCLVLRDWYRSHPPTGARLCLLLLYYVGGSISTAVAKYTCSMLHAPCCQSSQATRRKLQLQLRLQLQLVGRSSR